MMDISQDYAMLDLSGGNVVYNNPLPLGPTVETVQPVPDAVIAPVSDAVLVSQPVVTDSPSFVAPSDAVQDQTTYVPVSDYNGDCLTCQQDLMPVTTDQTTDSLADTVAVDTSSTTTPTTANKVIEWVKANPILAALAALGVYQFLIKGKQ